LISTGLSSIDHLLGTEGYPDKSTILVVGPPGIGKEALGYWNEVYSTKLLTDPVQAIKETEAEYVSEES
jgi:predicted ATP-dependent serine protease